VGFLLGGMVPLLTTRCLFRQEVVVLVDKSGGQQRCPPYLAAKIRINFTLIPIIEV